MKFLWKLVVLVGLVGCVSAYELPAGQDVLVPPPSPPPEQKPDFSKMYRDMGAPRFALYTNIKLNDEIREWKTESRKITTHEESFWWNRPHTDVDLSQERLELVQKRDETAESSIWVFEDAFTKPFLEAGASIVDRAMILRLAGAGQEVETGEVLSLKTIEMGALKQHADYLIEVLFSKNQEKRSFRVKAVSVETGELSASIAVTMDEIRKKHKDLDTTDQYARAIGMELADRFIETLYKNWSASVSSQE